MPTLVILLASLALAAPFPLDHNLFVEKIQPQVWVATDKNYFHSNVLISKMPDGTVVLASSPYENLGTQTLVKWIKRNLQPKHIIAVNTHFHLDGTGGNHVFHREGVETWSSDLTKELRRTEGPKVLKETLQYYESEALAKRVVATPNTPAKNIFALKEGKVFDLGGERVEVYFPGPTHSPDHVVVHLRDKGVLFGGCMVKPMRLGYLRDADVRAWPKSVANLRRFKPRVVIPGHGRWGGPELIERTLDVANKALGVKP